MNRIITRLFGSLTLCLFVTIINAQQHNELWTEIHPSQLEKDRIKAHVLEVDKFKVFELNYTELKERVRRSPQRFSAADNNLLLEFPLGDSLVSFAMFQATTLSPELAMRFPDIRTYTGKAAAGNARIRLTITPYGLYGIIVDNGEYTYLNPYTSDGLVYRIFKQGGLAEMERDFRCLNGPEEHKAFRPTGTTKEVFDDGKLSVYRLAVATSGEFAQFHIQEAGVQNGTEGEKKAAVLSAITVIINRINIVYETDMGISLSLIGNETDIIYLDPLTDPFQNNGNDVYTSITVINDVIGPGNYDVGHTMTTGSGGRAYVGVICNDGYKVGGTTGLSSPIGDPFAIDYVAHELGHQFGANHTFNGNVGSCNGNIHFPTAVEPGSGSTIMAYAGICTGQNVQFNSDPYFSFISIDEIHNYIVQGNGNTCGNKTSTGNHAPIINAMPTSYTVPYGTALKLSATASDQDGDAMTYTWEQNDLKQNVPIPPSPTATDGALFRSLPPDGEAIRYLPQKSSVLTGDLAPTWEVIPTVSRELNFALVVRDNNIAGGQAARKDVKINVANTGPFKITSQNIPGLTYNQNQNIQIDWDVAGTDGNGINTSQVDILLSYDNGKTFPVVLADNTSNDGSESLVIPDSACSPKCRVMIRPVQNIYYAVNSEPFAINGAPSCTFIPTPINDECSGAIEIPVTPAFPSRAIHGTMLGATPSLSTQGKCDNSSTDEDVWYKIIIPSSWPIAIQTYVTGGNSNSDNDYSMQIYAGSCGNLTYIYCNEDYMNGGNYAYFSPAQFMPGVNLNGGNQGQIIYIRLRKSASSRSDFYIAAYNPTIPVPLASGNCQNGSVQISKANSNAYRWTPLYDKNGALIALLHAHGQGLGTVSASTFINYGNVREDGNGRYYLDRDFTIVSTQQATQDVDINLYFKDTEYQALKALDPDVPQLSELNATRSDDLCGDKLTSGVFLPSIRAFNVWAHVKGIGITTDKLSKFYIHGGAIPLPVNLLEFQVQSSGENSIKLRWKVAGETHLDAYIIEKSIDKINYTAIGTINAEKKLTYRFTDHKPFAGNNYYRLRMVDTDGKSELSEVRMAVIDPHTAIHIYPNPVQDITFIAGLKGDEIIHLYDITGRIVKKIDSISPKTSLDVHELAQGVYFLKIASANGSNHIEKIIVQ